MLIVISILLASECITLKEANSLVNKNQELISELLYENEALRKKLKNQKRLRRKKGFATIK